MYTVGVYSLIQEGSTKLSANFTISEFACNDGSDVVLISQQLVSILQKIRNWAKAPVHINSAYRTPTYNKKIGGATYSQHQ